MGFVYLIQHELLLNTNKYKVGMSSSLNLNRLKFYKKNAILYNLHRCDNYIDLEKKIIDEFKKNFQLFSGNEYFMGDINDMSHCFIKTIFNDISPPEDRIKLDLDLEFDLDSDDLDNIEIIDPKEYYSKFDYNQKPFEKPVIIKNDIIYNVRSGILDCKKKKFNDGAIYFNIPEIINKDAKENNQSFQSLQTVSSVKENKIRDITNEYFNIKCELENNNFSSNCNQNLNNSNKYFQVNDKFKENQIDNNSNNLKKHKNPFEKFIYVNDL